MSFHSDSHSKTKQSFCGHNDIHKGRCGGGYAMGMIESSGSQRPHTFDIFWQDGPVDREAGELPNGAFVEDVLDVCKRRVEAYQKSDFPHEANERAAELIQAAIDVLNERRDERARRGVLGKNEA